MNTSGRILLALCLVATSTGLANADTLVLPDSATTAMVVRAFFQNDPNLNNINNTIDGILTSGIVMEDAQGEVRYDFASPVDGALAFKLWNNAGSRFDDGESIGLMDLQVFDNMDVKIFEALDVDVPEGAAGDPFKIDFGGVLNGVSWIKMVIKANNGATGNLDGVAWRDVALCVPEPTSLGLIGALGLVPLIRRRRG